MSKVNFWQSSTSWTKNGLKKCSISTDITDKSMFIEAKDHKYYREIYHHDYAYNFNSVLCAQILVEICFCLQKREILLSKSFWNTPCKLHANWSVLAQTILFRISILSILCEKLIKLKQCKSLKHFGIIVLCRIEMLLQALCWFSLIQKLELSLLQKKSKVLRKNNRTINKCCLWLNLHGILLFPSCSGT